MPTCLDEDPNFESWPPFTTSSQKKRGLMGIQSFPFGAIVLLQSFTLGILSWTVIEQRQLRRQLQITLEELGAIRDEEIQLARELPCDPNPSPGNGPTEPSKTPDGGQWNLEVALRGLLLQLGLVILVPVSLLALVGLWCFLRKWNAASEPQLPSTPAARQQLAQRQLAEVRLRRHGFGQ